MDAGSMLALATTIAADGRAGPSKTLATGTMDLANYAELEIAQLDHRERIMFAEQAKLEREQAELRAERLAWMTIIEKMSAAPTAAPAVAKPGRTRKAKAAAVPQIPPAEAVVAELERRAAAAADDALVIPAALDRRAAE